ncbi:hypothetical protein [Planomonospora parontospora]|uniref:hypothetical protein n=1 Tax=Planomonospora parontospora TaxID=58119 RepID=UPI0016703199|nr:hypothetical protein [Planomonospora parontospora]
MSSLPSRPGGGTSPHPTPAVSGSASSRSDLRKIFSLARDFASDIQHVLNATICNNASINAQRDITDPNIIAIGNRLTAASLRGELVPICARGKPTGWLKVEYLCGIDDAGKYLMVVNAFVGVYAADETRTPLCHFDYERDKSDGYPEAHVQVYGESSALATWGDRFTDRGLHRLHLPAGHRRFRWILEDVIEFLVSEGLAVPHNDTWRDVLKPGRKKFMQSQLRAAIRNDTETAVLYLSECDYSIRPPETVRRR